MKKLSVKMKIALWFGVLMVVVITLVLWFMQFISGSVIESNSKTTLTQTVENHLNDIEYDDDDGLEYDDLVFYKNGVYMQIYSDKGEKLAGNLPPDFSADVGFSDRQTQNIESHSVAYSVYDRRIFVKDYGYIWLRGIKENTEAAGAVSSIIQTAFFTLPLLLLIGILGSYFIVKRAFKPIAHINKTANEISEGKDLSRRIALGEGKDEVFTLANTFDRMFDRLEDSFEKEKQFTADVSHELRTPTSVILAQSEYGLKDADDIDECKSSFDVIHRQTGKMSNLISRLLQLSRMDRNKITLELEEFNFSELTQMVIEEQPKSDKNVTVTADIPPDIYIRADRSLISRILLNLLHNANQYNRKNGSIHIGVAEQGGSVSLSVKDNGIGIAESEIKKIFNRFYRADNARTATKENSLGLGLSMVKEIAVLHGGEISVTSELGKGSTFTLLLPKNI